MEIGDRSQLLYGPVASLASHVAAPALCELVSFHTAEHIRDEIRRIDGSVHLNFDSIHLFYAIVFVPMVRFIYNNHHHLHLQ